MHACLQCHFVRKSDMSSFMEDVSLIRPTELLMPPRITSMMHDRFQEMLAAKSAASPEQEQQQRQASLLHTLHARRRASQAGPWARMLTNRLWPGYAGLHVIFAVSWQLRALTQPVWACHSSSLCAEALLRMLG